MEHKIVVAKDRVNIPSSGKWTIQYDLESHHGADLEEHIKREMQWQEEQNKMLVEELCKI